VAVWLILAALLLWYFFVRNRGLSTQHVRHEPNSPTTDSGDELVDGYEFRATLWPYTPLEVLNHHGERVKREPENKLHKYGDSRDGIWLPFFDDDLSRPNRVQLRELEFLKKFRKTYESDLSHQRKHEIISALFEEYRDLPQQVSSAADWYLWELKEIQGISESIAKVLYFEGIKSKKDVEAASDEELLRIPGIGPGRLRQIRAYFSRPIGGRTSG